MAALSEILLPGERVVARYFPMGLIRGWFVIAGALPVLTTAAVWHRTGFADGELEWVLYVDGGFVLYLLLTTYFLGRWRLAVTDQRLLIREGAEYQDIQLDLIREVRYAGHTLTVRATDRTVETSILLPFARRIVRALDPSLETSGAPALKLAALINLDEAVLYRDPTTRSVKASLAFLAATSATAPVMVGYMKGFGDGSDWFTLGMFYAGLIPMAFQWKRHFGWKVAITGRRLLVRRHHDPDRYDEIALADILSAEPGDKGKKPVDPNRCPDTGYIHGETQGGEDSGGNRNREGGRVMARLKDMLEPGETVVYRGNSLTKFLRILAGTGAFLVLFLAVLFTDFNEQSVAEMLRALGLAGLVAFSILGVFTVVAIPLAMQFSPFVACIVSDRRILVRRGLFRPAISEIALPEVDNVAFRDSALRIAGADRVITLQPASLGIGADLLARILPHWFPDGGKPVARPGRVLQSGEEIVFHFPPRYLGWVGKAAPLGFAPLFLLIGHGDFVERDWSGIVSSLMLAALIFWFWYPSRDDRHGWLCIVTNRRLLQHFDWDHSRYEEIPLAEIEADWRSEFADKLAAIHKGRDLDIPAKGKDAERVLAAINAAKGGA